MAASLSSLKIIRNSGRHVFLRRPQLFPSLWLIYYRLALFYNTSFGKLLPVAFHLPPIHLHSFCLVCRDFRIFAVVFSVSFFILLSFLSSRTFFVVGFPFLLGSNFASLPFVPQPFAIQEYVVFTFAVDS